LLYSLIWLHHLMCFNVNWSGLNYHYSMTGIMPGHKLSLSFSIPSSTFESFLCCIMSECLMWFVCCVILEWASSRSTTLYSWTVMIIATLPPPCQLIENDDACEHFNYCHILTSDLWLVPRYYTQVMLWFYNCCCHLSWFVCPWMIGPAPPLRLSCTSYLQLYWIVRAGQHTVINNRKCSQLLWSPYYKLLDCCCNHRSNHQITCEHREYFSYDSLLWILWLALGVQTGCY